MAVRAVMPSWHTGGMVTLNGHVIREARKGRRWTQYDLADELGVSQPTVQRWEAGKREPDTLADFVNLCQKLSVSADALLGLQPSATSEAAAPWLPKPETIADLLAFAMKVGEDDLEKRGELLDYAHALHAGLTWIAKEPASEDDPGFLKAVRLRVVEEVDATNSTPSRAA